MKKLLLLFVFAGLVFSTSSCKKNDCPTCEEPELHGVGTWDVTNIVVQGQPQDLNDPDMACYATQEIVLNDTQDGESWFYAYWDSNNSTCASMDLTVTSWAENYDKGYLYITDTDGQNTWEDGFKFVGSDKIRYYLGADTYFEFTKQ